MPLTTQEEQLYRLLQQKSGLDQAAQAPTAPAAQQTPQINNPIDFRVIEQYIDSKVAEQVRSQASNPRINPALAAAAAAVQTPSDARPNQPMEKLINPERVIIDRLRPLVMSAMTFDQKGRFAEIALNVRMNARSKEEAYRVGIDAFCDFLKTNAGREWIQMGAAALLASISMAASDAVDVPAKVSVNQTPKEG